MIKYKFRNIDYVQNLSDASAVYILNTLSLQEVKLIFEKTGCDRLRMCDIIRIMPLIPEIFKPIQLERCSICGCDFEPHQDGHNFSKIDVGSKGREYVCDDCLESRCTTCGVCGNKKYNVVIMQDLKIIDYETKEVLQTISACKDCVDRTIKKLKKDLYNSEGITYGVLNCRISHNKFVYIVKEPVHLSRSEEYMLPEYLDRYFVCSYCGNVLPIANKDERGREPGHELCKKCGSYIKKRDSLKNYGYKPDAVFFKTETENSTAEYMGMEFETELSSAKHNEEISSELDLAFLGTNENESNWLYAKTDGSLSNGVEFVTHPISYKAWQTEYFDKLQNELIEKIKPYVVRKAKRAGIHIHVARKSLGTNQAKIIARLCYILSVDSNYNFLINFCNRSDDSMRHWANAYNCYRLTDGKNIVDSVYETSDRYRIVNLQNKNTIEFRCFGSIVDINEIKKYINFVHNIIDFCKTHEDSEIMNTDIEKLVNEGVL